MADAPAPAAPPPFDPAAAPRHIAIIMDGNGRWAEERGLARVKGHEAGAEAVRRTVDACGRWGIEALTLYAFSTENWNRPRTEVAVLMQLLRRFLRQECDELNRQNVRLRIIGQPERLPAATRKELERVQGVLDANTGLTLVVALSYGGRDEIVRAARRLAARCATGDLDPDAIDEDAFAGALDTAGLPDPDLLIRTAGEMRISNFLLWQVSYTEYYSARICWPDFDADALAEAIREYQHRRRTYGRAPGAGAEPAP